MEIVDKIIKKVGWDKMLHYLVGALLTSWASLFGLWAMIFSILFVVAISYLKEKLDDTFCKEDIIAATLCSATSIVVYILSVI